MADSIPYGRQWVNEEDIAEVVKVLRSPFLTQGPKVAEYEEALAAYFGSRFAVTCSSGTAALHLACLAADIGEGDLVLTSPITFVASANCALYTGARPDFVDVDQVTSNMDPQKLEERLAAAEAEGEQAAAVIPVHFAGHPADMVRISAVAKARNLVIIEDACHAWGAEYRDDSGAWHKVGSCAHSDMTVFSSHPLKHITTGEGGVVTTNDPDLYQKLLLFRSHGITKDPAGMAESDGPWYYEMQALGYNYRMTDFQCALGLSQLRRLDAFLERRRQIAGAYNSSFSDLSAAELPVELGGYRHSYHLYSLRLRDTDVELRRAAVQCLLEDDICVNVHYIPVHLQPYYRDKFGYEAGDFPVAENHYARSVSVPMFPAMTEVEVERVIASVKRAFSLREAPSASPLN